MNLTLKSNLEKAYAFLCEWENCEKNISERNNLLNATKAKLNYTIRDYRKSITPPKNESPLLILLKFFLLPIILLFSIIFSKLIEQREIKKDMACKTEYDNFIKENKERVYKLTVELNSLLVKKANLENQKSCLSFISYYGYRNKDAIKYMHALVVQGRCTTIQQAEKAYEKHMAVVCEIEERREEREETERRHRELQNSLDRIASSQEQINDNLEYIRRYK